MKRTAAFVVIGLAVAGLAKPQVNGGGVVPGPVNGNPTITSLPGLTTVAPTTGSGSVILSICHATYSFAVDGGGAPGLITPAANCTIPAKSTIYNVAIKWSTPGVGIGNTTSIGVTGTGGGVATMLGATAVASLTGIVQGLVLPSVASGWVTITTAGAVTLTTAVAALSVGVCEIYVFYFTSPT